MTTTMYAGSTSAPGVQSSVRIGKFKGSLLVTKQAWAILKKDKEILWLPILSAISSAVVLGIMALIYLAVVGVSDASNAGAASSTVSYALLFIYYLATFFVINFYEASIMVIAHGRMNGKDLSLKDGLSASFKNVGKIFVWSLISATVGVILKAIANKKNIFAKILAAVLGAAWSILTFFSLPSLIIGGTGVLQSFKDSAATIRKVWGETFIVSVGVGFIFGLITFGGIIVSGIILISFPYAAVVVTVVIAFIIFCILLSIISSSLGSIFKVALYEYATTGRVPEGFSPEVISSVAKQP
jgi:hypothetical protein